MTVTLKTLNRGQQPVTPSMVRRRLALGWAGLGTGLGAIAAVGLLAPVPSNAVMARPTAPASLPAQSRQIAAAPTNLEQAVLQQINQYRASRKLAPLKLDARISAQAAAHSQAMAAGKVPFSHNGFNQRVQTIARSLPYSSAAENVAYNQGYADPATQAVQGWLKSPGHLKNIQGQFNLTGISVVRNAKGEFYFTQIFIRSR
jgi:uncharacterized protein YkwD